MRTLGLVPARSGSKRLPGKNLAQINGKSLVRIAAECGLATPLDHVIVSTDSEEIWLSAAACGETERLSWHQRPAAWAADDTTMMQVVHEVLRTTTIRDWDVLVLLQPTSPLRTPDDVRAVLRLMDGADAAFTVVGLFNGELRGGLYRDGWGGRVHHIRLESGEYVTQNGAVYAMTRAAIGQFYDWNDHLPPQTRRFLMPLSRSVDINYQHDLDDAIWHAARTAEVA